VGKRGDEVCAVVRMRDGCLGWNGETNSVRGKNAEEGVVDVRLVSLISRLLSTVIPSLESF
jgi:hypothetical protein